MQMQTFVSIKPLFYVLRILSELIKFNQLTYSFDYLQGKLPVIYKNTYRHTINLCLDSVDVSDVALHHQSPRGCVHLLFLLQST